MEKEKRDYLKKNIYNFSLLDILKEEKLDYSFVIKYILNKNYQFTEEEENITIEDVLVNQKHLNKNVLEYKICNGYMSDDSVDNFDTYTR